MRPVLVALLLLPVLAAADPVPVPGDYAVVGTEQLVTFDAGVWTSWGATPSTFTFGAPGDLPVPRDYDSDGILDLSVLRPSTSEWFIRSTRDGVIYRCPIATTNLCAIVPSTD